MFTDKEIKNIKDKIEKLEKKDIDLIVCDYDNTIFSRKDQLEDSELLRNNRGDKGNDVMKNIIGFENIIKNYYTNKKYPTIITSKLRTNHDLILTAGYQELQDMKIKASNLNHFNYIIVEKAEFKILKTIEYIIDTLKFIPNKVTIYEDRPKYFIEYKKTLENLFGINFDIMLVEMIDNKKNPIIKKIETI